MAPKSNLFIYWFAVIGSIPLFLVIGAAFSVIMAALVALAAAVLLCGTAFLIGASVETAGMSSLWIGAAVGVVDFIYKTWKFVNQTLDRVSDRLARIRMEKLEREAEGRPL